MALVSCDRGRVDAFRWLDERGVSATGASLVRAVATRDANLTARLLEAGVHTELRDAGGRTPLRIAVDHQDAELARMLINAGADVNASAGGAASILGHAIVSGNRSLARTLIASGARTDGLLPDGEAILPWAIRSGNREWTTIALRSDVDPRLRDREGTPLLHLAVRSGDEELARELLRLGADPAERDPLGFSALQIALRDGRKPLARKLVEAGADPNAHGPDGRSLLETAVERRDFQRVVDLLRLGANPDHYGGMGGASEGPFERAFRSGDSEMLACFLRCGARPADGGASWLAGCLRDGRVRDAALLLEHGCRGPAGSPRSHAVERAVRDGRPALAKLLLDHGFPPGRSLAIAAMRGDTATAGLLLAAGAPPDQTIFPYADTALAAAIRGRHDRLAVELLRRGADHSIPPPEGQTLFHLAVARSCPETVRFLLGRGADPNAPFAEPVSRRFAELYPKGVMRWVLLKDSGATPLMLAAHSGNIPTARYLLDAGAKSNVRTRKAGMWPINFASRRSDVAMMRLFLGRDPRNEERRIVIRLSEQRARMFDADGREIFETRVSTGRKGYATPTGTYVITNKYRDWTSTLYDASMPYFQRLSCGDFGLHQGNVPNHPASHGCIRVPAGVAARLFSITKTGDRVTILP